MIRQWCLLVWALGVILAGPSALAGRLLATYPDPTGWVEAELDGLAPQGAAQFSPQVLAEVQAKVAALADQNDDAIATPDLEDMRAIPFITMDNDDSKDLDQALAIDSQGEEANKRYRIYYAIADASSFVEPGMALDDQAKARGFTTYLPHKSLPLLPRELSEGQTSINPQRQRRALVVEMELDGQGRKIGQQLHHALIKSRAQTSYRQVQEYLNGGQVGELADQQYSKTLALLPEVGERRLKLARERHVLAYPSSEVRMKKSKDPQGVTVWEFEQPDHYKTEEWNAEISILANQAVGDFIAEQGKHSIHRAQRDAHLKGEHLCKVLSEYDSDAERIGALCNDIATLSSDELDERLSRYIDQLRPGSNEHDRFLIGQVLSMKANAATFSPDQNYHAGLKVSCYDQFTAPMRRYTDIVVHRIVEALLANKPVPYQKGGELLALASDLNSAAKREKLLGRSVQLLEQNLILATQVGKPLKGRVVFVRKGMIQLQFDDYPFNYSFPKESLRTKGYLKSDQRVEFTVHQLDPQTGKGSFQLQNLDS